MVNTLYSSATEPDAQQKRGCDVPLRAHPEAIWTLSVRLARMVPRTMRTAARRTLVQALVDVVKLKQGEAWTCALGFILYAVPLSVLDRTIPFILMDPLPAML